MKLDVEVGEKAREKPKRYHWMETTAQERAQSCMSESEFRVSARPA